MKRIFRKNQIVITALAVMIAVAGYLNYAGKEDLTGGVNEVGLTEVSDTDILAENGGLIEDALGEDGTPVVMDIGSLDFDLTDEAADVANSDDVNDGAFDDVASPGEAVLTSGQTVVEYIADVQLSREQVRAKNKETLLEVINNEYIAEEQKQEAIDKMVALTDLAEKENSAETLLKAKGFVNPVVSITDGKVDVVISAASITDAQRAQVEDIVKRKTEVSAENIIITLLDLAQ